MYYWILFENETKPKQWFFETTKKMAELLPQAIENYGNLIWMVKVIQ